MNSKLVVLFDIDGTLLRCGGAGGLALCEALGQEFGVTSVRPVVLHGRTDLGIANELLEFHGLATNSENRHRLFQRYFGLLPDHLHKKQSEELATVLPGVVDLLECVSADSLFVAGLLTGNMPTSAKIKLQHFSLWNYFKLGVFGDLADHRPNLAQPAREIVAQHCGYPVSSDSIVVIGDTPLDVELARQLQARCLTVCTGGFCKDELAFAGSDCTLDDLSDTAFVVDWLRNG